MDKHGGQRLNIPRQAVFGKKFITMFTALKRTKKNAKRNWAKWLTSFASPPKRYLMQPSFWAPMTRLSGRIKRPEKFLVLQQSDKGQRIPNLIRFPEFIRYLKSGNYSEAVILPSPVDQSHYTGGADCYLWRRTCDCCWLRMLRS